MISLKFYQSLIFLSLISLPFALYAQEDDLREYYPLKEGNIWVYEKREGNELSLEKLEINGREYVNNVETTKIIYDDGDYECVAVNSEGVKLYKFVASDGSSYELLTPPEVILPLNVGPTKRYKYVFSDYDNNGNPNLDTSGETLLEINFVGREDVIVPAGKFLNCIRVLKTFTETDREGNFAEEKRTIWFAEGVGKVKEIIEELGYEPGKGTYTYIKKFELKSAIVNDIRYGKKN
ncbi:MAG: hypothetical protein ISS47_03645 [Candidatus Omnitrophica bacterium]|nr:hypothetical protein [Candidatus Omnitrophota bacterium]